MQVSLLVATNSGLPGILRFLDRLKNNSPGIDWELVLVLNGDAVKLYRELTTLSYDKDINLLCCDKKGKSVALNLGLGHCSGEYILYTDDDSTPCRDWIDIMYNKAKQYPDIKLFGGPVLVDTEHAPQWIICSHNLQEILLTFHLPYDTTKLYDDGVYPVGPNMMMMNDIHARSIWSEMFGPGTDIPVGDEKLAIFNYSDKPADILYVKDSVVYHDVSDTVRSYCTILRRCYYGGLSAGIVNRIFHTHEVRKTNHHHIKTILINMRLREMVCVFVRLTGYLCGKYAYRNIKYDSL